ncbi:MAG: hypothetical protein O7H41_11130 [Planctomycetota bacterium]|nr:hypothetical protein [Planctomycetota bacterium]
MPDDMTIECKVCGEEKTAAEIFIAPPNPGTDPSAETEKWSGLICTDCREKMKESS